MAAVSQLIGQGIGFSPGSVTYIVLDGLGPAAVQAGTIRSLTLGARETTFTLGTRNRAMTLGDRETTFTLPSR